jgi:T5SS/PEP-CTERM-associated repeat protein
VGENGSSNSLTIENGGKLVNFGFGYVSHYYASNNTLLVAGPGSSCTGSNLYVGGGIGTGNSLVISNGGQVVNSGFGTIGVFPDANSVLVTGPGSVWSIGTDLHVGGFGKRNSLVISNGAQVVNASGAIGAYSLGSNNSVRVADNAVWRNTTLRVGDQGSSNTLVVAGGTVYSTNLTVGFASSNCNNLVALDSGSVVATNATHNAVVEVRRGQLIVTGGILQADILVITNACEQFVHTGGAVIVGSVVLDPNTFRIVSVAPQGNDMLITWMMGPGITNALQVATGEVGGSYNTNGYSDIFIVTNNTGIGTVTNYLDIGAATNSPSRYYRARLVP